MKKMIGLLLYGAIIFGVTAGVGMFMAKKQAAHSTAEDSEEHGDEEETSEGHGDSSHGDDGHGATDSKMTLRHSRATVLMRNRMRTSNFRLRFVHRR